MLRILLCLTLAGCAMPGADFTPITMAGAQCKKDCASVPCVMGGMSCYRTTETCMATCRDVDRLAK